MKQKKKRGLSVLFAMVMCLSIFLQNNITEVRATQVSEDRLLESSLAVAENEYQGDEIGVGVILANQQERKIDENASIVGNGVRLRKRPNVDATILELMYNNESVCINYTKSGETGGRWFYVKRVKTGTWGWVKHNYVYEWD